MSPSLKSGLVRLCTLLSIIWVLIVGGVLLHEGQDPGKLCSATDTLLSRECHQFFWKWQLPDDTAQPVQGEAQEQKAQGIHIHIGKINLDVQRARPLEHRLNVEHLAMGLIVPLSIIWGIGFGVAWCVDGFRKKA